MSTAFAPPTPQASPSRAARHGFTAQQRWLIHVLAQGVSVTQAAEETVVHRTTISHWQRSNPLFLLELEQARPEISAKLRDQYVALAPLAMEALRDLLANPTTPAATRLKAITLVLNAGMAEVDPAHLDPAVETAIHQNSSLCEDAETAGPDPAPPEPVPPAFPPNSIILRRNGRPLAAHGILDPEAHNEIRQNSSQSPPLPYRSAPRPGRKERCPCGTGQKYKRCCGR